MFNKAQWRWRDMKPKLDEIKLAEGMTAAEWLRTQPEKWQSVATDAIYECLNQKWPITGLSIQMMARRLMKEGNAERALN